MRLILVLGLVLVGVLEIPLSYDLKIKQMIKGEVKGEEVSLQNFFEPAVQDSVPSLPPSSPRLFSTPATTSSQASPTPATQTANEIVLLNKEKKLQDKKLEINFPILDSNQNWFLTMEFELISTEDVWGFDYPGLTIHLDDHLAYQQSVFEKEIKTISFDVKVFSNQPQILSIWSGNRGDELKDTYVIIKNIKLISQNNHSFIETESINDLVLTIDSKDFFTLEWSSPKTNDVNLNKALTYDLRYSSATITQQNWFQAQSVAVFLPKYFSPQLPKTREIILIKAPEIKSGYLAIRSLDSAGVLSPLGENVSFANLND